MAVDERTAKTREPNIPHNTDAERNVLGSILMVDGVMDEVAPLLQPADFWDEKHRIIYQAMMDLRSEGAPVDISTVWERIGRTNHAGYFDSVGEISSLPNYVPTSSHATYYASIVVNLAHHRRLVHLWQQHAMLGYDTSVDPLESVSQLQRELAVEADRIIASAQTRNRDEYTADELVALDLPEPRDIVTGLLPEGLTLFGGKQKTGKSWFALNVMLSIAMGTSALGYTSVDPGSVLYLALEDRVADMRERLLQCLCGDPAPRNLTLRFSSPRQSDGGLAVVESWLRRVDNPRAVWIDTLAVFRDPADTERNPYDADYEMMRQIKRIADEWKIAIVLLHHLRKAGSTDDDPVEEIIGSTALTGAADNILVLKRPRGSNDGTLHIHSRRMQDGKYALRFDDLNGLWTITGRADEVQHSRAEQEVMRAIREAECALSPRDLGQLTSLNYNTLKSLVWRMAKKGILVADAHGKYSIVKPS